MPLPAGFQLESEPSGLPEGFSVEEPEAAAPEEQSFLEAAGETARTIAQGAAVQSGSGLAGLIELGMTQDPQKAAAVIERIQSEYGYTPKGERSKAQLKGIGETVQDVVDVANIPVSGIAGLTELATGQGLPQAVETIESVQEKGFGKTAGGRVFEETGSPLAATVAELSPDIAASLIPGAGLVKSRGARAGFDPDVGDVAEKVKEVFTTQSPVKQEIAKKIQEGSPDVDTAKYELTDTGKVKADTQAREAVKQGFDEGVIAAVKASSPADKKKMQQMADTMQKSKRNKRFAMQNRPSDIAGDSLLERFRVVNRENRKSGKALDREANKLKGEKVDFSSAVNSFRDDLEGMGVTLSDDFTPSFKGSDIEGIDAAEGAINKVITRMKKGEDLDAYDIHRMKKFIDENVTYGKAGEGLKGKTERVLKKLRRNLDKSLDDNFDSYKKVNDTYSETITAIDALQDAAGKKIDLKGENADKAVGTVLRRLMSNAQSRVSLMDSVENLEALSKKYGGKHEDDILNQMLFADELDSVFGPTARTSLAGETGKAFKKGADVVRRGPYDAALDLAGDVVEKVRGINEEGAFKSIKELLKK